MKVLFAKFYFVDWPDSKMKCDNKLTTDICMEPFDSLCSNNKLYKLKFEESNGNLVIYKIQNSTIENAGWSTRTNHVGAFKVCLSSNGSLIIFNREDLKVWTSRSEVNYASDVYALLEDTGALVIYADNKKIWSSGSC